MAAEGSLERKERAREASRSGVISERLLKAAGVGRLPATLVDAMISDDTAQPPANPTFAAQPRAVRLRAKEAAPAAKIPAPEPKLPPPPEASRLEKKMAGMYDAQEMLRVLDTELTLQRTARLHGSGGKSRQAMRVLSVTVLFALLIAALAAMGWLQSRLAQSGVSRHRTEARSQR